MPILLSVCLESIIKDQSLTPDAEELAMRSSTLFSLVFLAAVLLVPKASAQADSICSEFGGGFIWATASVVYGRVEFSGLQDPNRFPKVTVTLINQGRTIASTSLGPSGNYCFRNVSGNGATLVVAVEDAEVGRRDLPSGSVTINQVRQDFQIDLGTRTPRAGVISAKYFYERSGKNAELFASANAHLREKKADKAIPLLAQIVQNDPKDFVAMGLLGSAYFEKGDQVNAEKAFLGALDANPRFAPAMASLGQIYLLQNKLDLSVAVLLKATENEPEYARGFRLLGEAYLLSKQGRLGLEALYRAIELDPIGMAESHLLAAKLFDSAGAKNYAAREYRLFLEKVPNHPQKKQFQKYIQENPPADN